jgi:hypothetical protein
MQYQMPNVQRCIGSSLVGNVVKLWIPNKIHAGKAERTGMNTREEYNYFYSRFLSDLSVFPAMYYEIHDR